MPKTVLLDELHLTVRIPADLPAARAAAARGVVAGAAFLVRLRWAVRAAVRAFPELTPVRVRIAR